MLSDDAVDVAVAALPARIPRPLLARAIAYTPLFFLAPRAECEVSRMVERDAIDWAKVPMIFPSRAWRGRASSAGFAASARAARVRRGLGNEAALSLISLGCGVGRGAGPGHGEEPAPFRSAHLLDAGRACPTSASACA